MIGDVTAYWNNLAGELSTYLGVIPNVLQDDDKTYAFLLGNYEVLRLAQRSTYIHVSYEEWGPSQPEMKTNQYHGALLAGVEYVAPQVVNNLFEFKQTAKLLGSF
jgi:hypothetical protein